MRYRYEGAGKVSLERYQVPWDLLAGEACTPLNLAELKMGSPLLIQGVRLKHSPQHGMLSDRFSGRALLL